MQCHIYSQGVLKCPSSHEVRFSPKSGFIVTSQTLLAGKYVCIGSFNGTQQSPQMMQLVEYTVVQSDELGKLRQRQVDQLSQDEKADGILTLLSFDLIINRLRNAL